MGNDMGEGMGEGIGEPATRRVALTGCVNFRDLGGYPVEGGGTVRWGRLFRSDSLHRLTDDDLACLADTVRPATVIDLRAADERDHAGPGALDALDRLSCRVEHLPLADRVFNRDPDEPVPDVDMGEIYLLMMRFAGDRIANVLRVLTEPGAYPAVVFCAGGKDRTGVVSAVVLGLVGVGDDDIVHDYALTREYLSPIFDRRRRADSPYVSAMERLPDSAFDAAPETMVSLLAAVRREFGSMVGYAESIGVDAADVARLRANLIG